MYPTVSNNSGQVLLVVPKVGEVDDWAKFPYAGASVVAELAQLTRSYSKIACCVWQCCHRVVARYMHTVEITCKHHHHMLVLAPVVVIVVLLLLPHYHLLLLFFSCSSCSCVTSSLRWAS